MIQAPKKLPFPISIVMLVIESVLESLFIKNARFALLLVVVGLAILVALGWIPLIIYLAILAAVGFLLRAP